MKQSISASPKTSLSFFAIALGITLVMYSWAFFVLPGAWISLFSVPLWLGLLWLISRRFRLRERRLMITPWRKWGFWLLVILLVVMAPICSYLYGAYLATHLFNELDVEATMVGQNPVLLDRFGDIGPPRSLIVKYTVDEPIESADAKIRMRLEGRSEWRSVERTQHSLYPIVARFWCEHANLQEHITSVVLLETGELLIDVGYAAPRSCIGDWGPL